VLLNVVMPEMTGPELLAVLRAHRELRTLPVIVISATYAEPDGSNGEARFLRKPVSAEVLLSVVADYCDPPGRRQAASAPARDPDDGRARAVPSTADARTSSLSQAPPSRTS
jgi:CheY-like chemotaxis protein